MKAARLLLTAGCLGLGIVGIALTSGDDQPKHDDMPASAAPAKPSYAGQVAAILNDHCVECHRPGEVAPFSLIGYENAKKWAKMVSTVAGSKQMPPWKAVRGYGEFLDENRLSPMEIETLKRWTDNGAPRGDSKKEPATPKFTSEWPLGKPDMILEPEKEFHLGAEGDDVYRNFVMKNDFDKDVWVQAMAVKPGNTKVVHHVIAFLDRTGTAVKKAAAQTDGEPGYESFGGPGFLPSGSLGGWAPGLVTRRTPDGVAFKVTAGTKIVLQVHYHRSGKPEADKTRIGLYLAKKPVTDELELAWLLNLAIHIKPGLDNQKFTISKKIPRDITLYSVLPHMHLLGKSMKAWVEMPDGNEKPLIFVDDWDFNWQMAYMLKEPMKIPAGSTIRVEAVYDNTSDNPNNPNNPPKLVTFGEATTDEMMLLVAAYTVDK